MKTLELTNMQPIGKVSHFAQDQKLQSGLGELIRLENGL